MSKHSPGPWEYDGKGNIICRPDPNNKDLCRVVCRMNDAWSIQLILAAPELLEALKSLLQVTETCMRPYAGDREAFYMVGVAESLAIKAIAKAEEKNE